MKLQVIGLFEISKNLFISFILVMILLILNSVTLSKCFLIALIFEIFRVLTALLLARPSSKVTLLTSEKLTTQIELSTIKSVQLELVKHSKLTRKLIKIDKELETVQAQYIPKAKKVKKLLRIFRVIYY
jgi:hypothetical protein